jgi:hypothetical protein
MQLQFKITKACLSESQAIPPSILNPDNLLLVPITKNPKYPPFEMNRQRPFLAAALLAFAIAAPDPLPVPKGSIVCTSAGWDDFVVFFTTNYLSFGDSCKIPW